MANGNDLLDSWKRAEAALEEANQNFTAEGRQLRIFINNQLADACYQMHDLLKAQGRDAEANAAHRQGNKFWGRVQEELADDAVPPPHQPNFELK
jgi:hypothetical protein